MGSDSLIGWTRHTFNGVWGCTKVADGCTFCYAEGQSKRYGNDVWGPKKMRRYIKSGFSDAPEWNQVAKNANQYHRVFAYSMGDVMEEPMPCCDHKGQALGFDTDEVRRQLWRLIEETRNLQWLLLTKRPAEIGDRIPQSWVDKGAPRNVMFGTSISSPKDLHYVRELFYNAPRSGDGPSRLFCSVEPMIQKFSKFVVDEHPWIEWWILGGESGPHARPCNPIGWFDPFIKARHITGSKVFVKQTGTVYARERGLSGKGERPHEWPEWMRVQETPEEPRW